MAAVPTPLVNSTGGTIGVTFYMVGGGAMGNIGSISNVLYGYNTSTNTWNTLLATMPTARTRLASAVINGILYVVGGQDGGGNPLNTLEAYNPGTDSWAELAAMPTARYLLGAASVNGILYAVGGQNGNGALTTLEAYDPGSNTWTAKQPMLYNQNSLGVAAVGGLVYAIGAGDGDYGSDVEAYNPQTNSWIPEGFPARGQQPLRCRRRQPLHRGHGRKRRGKQREPLRSRRQRLVPPAPCLPPAGTDLRKRWKQGLCPGRQQHH